MSNEARICADLREHLGSAIKSAEPGKPGRFTVRLDKERIRDLMVRLRDEHDFDQCSFVSGIDWVEHLEVLYVMVSTTHPLVAEVYCQVPLDSPHIASITDLWSSANWHERETWEMFGIDFPGHPDLRRLLLTEDWRGNPLLKNVAWGRYDG